MATKESHRNWSYLLVGIGFICLGLATIVFKASLFKVMMDLFAVYLTMTGAIKVWELVTSNKYAGSAKDRRLHIFVAIAHFWFAAVVHLFNDHSAWWVVTLVGLYQLVMAFLSMVSFYLMRKDRAQESYRRFLYALVHLIFGLSSLMVSDHGDSAMNRLGIYTIFIGLTYLHDGRGVFIDPAKETQLRRSIRIPLPAIFSVFFPRTVLQKINRIITGTSPIDQEVLMQELDLLTEEDSDLEETGDKRMYIQIHVGEKSVDMVGHMNVVYDEVVYSYGNHDVDSRRLFDAVGDGVIVLLDRQEYIDFSVENGTTIVEYEVELTRIQRQALEKKLDEIKRDLIDWQPRTKTQRAAYAGKLDQATSGTFHKFAQGKYQTYFVFWTNCVLLSDEIMGAAGLDVFPLIGVQTPGTYYDYFEREYAKVHSMVTRRTVYNHKLRSFLAQHVYPLKK